MDFTSWPPQGSGFAFRGIILSLITILMVCRSFTTEAERNEYKREILSVKLTSCYPRNRNTKEEKKMVYENSTVDRS